LVYYGLGHNIPKYNPAGVIGPVTPDPLCCPADSFLYGSVNEFHYCWPLYIEPAAPVT